MLRVVAIVALLLLAGGAVAFAVLREDDEPAAPVAESGPARGATTGVLTDVEEERLMLTPEGGGPAEVFGLRPADRGRIDLFHLLEHVREKWPVRVAWERLDGVRYAVSVEDA